MRFAKNLKEYLLSGAGLEELCGIVCMEDEEGNPLYEEFIYAVMDSKLHIKQKNTMDYLDTQQQEERPYGIWTLMAQFAYGFAHNRKVDRYVPIEEIRQALRRGIGDKCDTDRYIDQYLEKEAADPEINVYKENITEAEMMKMADVDTAEVFTQLVNRRMEKIHNRQKQYDNSDYRDLLDYKKGDTVAPALKKAVGESFEFYHKATEEKRYAELMEGSHNERCIFLIEQDQQFWFRDKDWMEIFSDMEKHPESYERYYPMVRVKIDSRELNYLLRALVLNDALYESAEEWSREYE